MKSLLLLCFLPVWSVTLCAAETEESPERYEKEVIAGNLADPLQLDLTPDGRIFFIERAGAVKTRDPATRLTTPVLQLATTTDSDAGALALALHPDFSRNPHVFVYYTATPAPLVMRLARYTWDGTRLTDGRTMLEVPLEPGAKPYHCGGGLAWDREGNLLLSTGDNSAPQEVPAVHPLERARDSRRSAGNSMDLRGKILRFTPQPDGRYTCPPGNLFPDATQGRPEIFAMGVRNPFRVAADPDTGLVTWGDVGGNVKVELGLGPEGSDEINVTARAGFFGWPWLSGASGVWRPFDPATKQAAGAFFDPAKIVNDSPQNTGLKNLPPALPPVLFYSNTPSPTWPFLGSGGRSVTGGIFYRTISTDPLRLPDSLRGAIIFGDWMRNWLAVARVTPEGQLISAGPFLRHLSFRRPADFKTGPEGALYVAEYGESWTGNTSGQISRVIYRRGNRPPALSLTADRSTGGVPLTVRVTAQVSDPDEPAAGLKIRWELPEGLPPAPEGPNAKITFPAAGSSPVRAVVTDGAGATTMASLTISAGNEAPVVRFTAPEDGSFFEYGMPISWQVRATDAEDGPLPAEQVRVEQARYDVSPLDRTVPPGLALMRGTTCFACHQAATASAGPAYLAVARRYATDAAAPARLAQKIQSGGSGVWGELPMPPHPQHSPAECAQMVEWILSLAQNESQILAPALEGTVQLTAPKAAWGQLRNGVVFFTATATDKGAGALTPLSSSPATLQLRTRRQRACFFDSGERAVRQDNLDQGGMVARISAGGSITFRHIALSECGGLSLEAWPQGAAPLTIEIRRADGTVLSRQEAAPVPGTGKPRQISFPFPTPPAAAAPEDLSIHLTGPPDALLDLMWVDFRPATP